VAALDLHDASCGREHVGVLDERPSAVVGADPRVLQDVGLTQVALGRRVRVAEVKARLCDGGAPQLLDERAERLDVLGLVVAQLLGELRRAALEIQLVQRADVELRLEDSSVRANWRISTSLPCASALPTNGPTEAAP